MEIVVLDGYTTNPGDLSWREIEKVGKLKVYERTTFEEKDYKKIIDRIGSAEAVLTNKTPITKEVLKNVPKLKYIGVLATGYNVIDVEEAKERGITVTNIPDYGTSSVAQMTFALMLELCNQVGSHNNSVKKGEWGRKEDWCFWNYPLIELSGKVLGIVGYGKIGKSVSRIAEAFGMHVIVYNRGSKIASEESIRRLPAKEFFKEADIISLHCPLTEETKEIINNQTINMMKTGVIIINTARGQLIAEDALYDALSNGKVRGAALDVMSTEPISDENPLLQAENCIITPHISWAPKEARERLLEIAAKNLSNFIESKPINVVNP